MNREEMLSFLGNLKFELIWPGNWEDIGFTEREIWINSKGYGYIMCDEPTQHWEGEGLGSEKWAEIKEKIQEETLVYEDIEGTSLESMLDAIHFGYDFEDQEQLCMELSDLSETDYPINYFYAMATIEGTQYFDSEQSFKNAYERNDADEYWEDMDDDMLATWVERLADTEEEKQ